MPLRSKRSHLQTAVRFQKDGIANSTNSPTKATPMQAISQCRAGEGGRGAEHKVSPKVVCIGEYGSDAARILREARRSVPMHLAELACPLGLRLASSGAGH